MKRYHIYQQRTIGNIKLIETYYPAQCYYTWHYDGLSKLSIVLSGTLRERHGNHEEIASSTSFVIKPNFIKHENLFGPLGARVISFIPKDPLFQEWLNQKEITGLKWFHGVEASRVIIRLLRLVKGRPDPNEVEDSLIDLFGLQSTSKRLRQKAKPDWLVLLEQRLRDEFEQPIRTRDLASWVGLHPVYMARVFRKYFDCSIKEFIGRLRLKRAMHDLSIDQHSLSHIAYDLGFADQSHMTRVFNKDLNISPGKFRKLIQLQL